MNDSEIQNFYKNQTIFLTGGTGFLGKVLIEKLLRTCDICKIYVLLRPKKGKTIQERINTFFNYPCFDRLRKEKTDFAHLVLFVEGDCAEINLGLNSDIERVLTEETNVVIHAAANVKLDQPLRQAANNNLRSTRDALELAKKMHLLKVFVYVSTAFSNCSYRHIGEEFYTPPLSAKQFLNILDEIDDQVLERITPEIITPWPNTYTFTKSVAEDLIKTEGKNLPVAIIRPAIISSTLEEPMPGWIDNLYGVVGIVFGAGIGVLRSVNAKLDNVSFIIPCDYVANLVLASAWNTAKDKQDNIRIYNYVGSKANSITWEKLMKTGEEYRWDAASEKIIWHYAFKLRENHLWHKLCIFFQHTVVAYIVDFILICLRRQPIAVKNYDRLNKLLSSITYFTTNSLTFESNNVEELWEQMKDSDKKRFAFDMQSVDWRSYLRSTVIGIKLYLLKDPIETLPQGQKKIKILAVAHYSLLTVFYILLCLLFWYICRLLL